MSVHQPLQRQRYMGNKPGRSPRGGGPTVITSGDAPVVDLALEAAEQRLALAMLAHRRLGPEPGAGRGSADAEAEPALVPGAHRAVLGELGEQVAQAMPLVLAGRYSGTWAMLGAEEPSSRGPGEAAEISGLTGRGPTTTADERQYCYAVTIDTARFEVRRRSPREVAGVVGSVEWKLLRAPRSAPMQLSARAGESALEHVEGSLNPSDTCDISGLLELSGHSSSDPTLIGTDSYRLRLVRVALAAGGGAAAAAGRVAAVGTSVELRGASRGAKGKWDAQLRLKREVAPVRQDADGFFTALS